jgi:hypothetical protein
MYGVCCGIRSFSAESAPEPLPAACSEPSYLAKYLWSIGTTAGRFLLNRRFHFFSRICSPWYARVSDLADHFCWKYVLDDVFGALSCDILYSDQRDQSCLTFYRHVSIVWAWVHLKFIGTDQLL